MRYTHKGKIAVAMSGGIDSSVSAMLLKEEGFEVIGVHLKLWRCPSGVAKRSCCGPMDMEDARRVAETLGISFVTLDMTEVFKEKVILPFVKDYSRGRTPNPCILCNDYIKFGALIEWLESELGVYRLATGHHARIQEENGRYLLLKGKDPSKDQSYFLFDIKKEMLPKLLFPVGGYTKEEVRKIGSRLHVAEKRESEDICFLLDGDPAAFIERFYPEYAREGGAFLDENGKVLGRHRGIHAFTIGQRRGLGMGFGKRTYVKEIRESGEVVLADDASLYRDSCTIEKVNLLSDVSAKFDADVKIRYRTAHVPARISLFEGDKARIDFSKKVRAITPGQAAVFYIGEEVVGGGWIVS